MADILEAKNTSELTKEQTKEVARRCLWYMSVAGNDASVCENLPIFLSGSDVPTATLHDLKALAGHPQWARLNYESATVKEGRGISRQWYKGLGGCSGTPPVGETCDEYPFFASQQGGPNASPTPSLEYINSEDNRKQGSNYSGFLSSCKVSEGAPFLAVPIPPSVGIPTVRLCN